MKYSKEDIRNALIPWDLEKALDLLNDGLNPQDFVIPYQNDILNQFILKSHRNYVEVIISDNDFDLYKNGFNYLLSALKVINPEKRDFKTFAEILKKTGINMCLMENDLGENPWFYAFYNGYLKPVNLMLSVGVDINQKDVLGRSGLFYYFRNNKVSDNFLNLIIKNKNLIDWVKRDVYGVSLNDVLLSAKNSHVWMEHKNHLELIKVIGLDKVV